MKRIATLLPARVPGIVFLALAAISPARGEGAEVGFPEGANCLFIGHSFFAPVAKSFDRLATASGFAEHKGHVVFSPGPSGTPGSLWANPGQREKIEAILATGEVDLLGMTTNIPGGSIEDYQCWIGLALDHNPKTEFMIGQFWMVGGPNLDDETFRHLTEVMAQTSFEDIEELRRTCPNPIHFVNYGQVGPDMKIQFSAGKLPDIEVLVGRGRHALFLDGRIGHAGPLMHELCALTWMAALYRADPEKVKHSDFSPQAAEIARRAIENNRQFR